CTPAASPRRQAILPRTVISSAHLSAALSSLARSRAALSILHPVTETSWSCTGHGPPDSRASRTARARPRLLARRRLRPLPADMAATFAANGQRAVKAKHQARINAVARLLRLEPAGKKTTPRAPPATPRAT